LNFSQNFILLRRTTHIHATTFIAMKRFNGAVVVLVLSWGYLLQMSLADDEDDNGGGSSPNPSPTQLVKLCPTHPNIDEVLKRGGSSYQIPSTHPTIHPLFTNVMPRGLETISSL
jgi:hypothetical protein